MATSFVRSAQRFALRNVFCLLLAFTACSASAEGDWRHDYAVAPGFRIQRDTVGFNLPSAIAFVPKPGPGPKDPLYFVTELRGKVKVVTNDRSIYTFAEGFQHLVPKKEIPDHLGEIGMAGICLEPEHGYVFVSYAYEDKDGIYRNGITRFDSTPGTFSLKPSGQKRLATMFDKFLSNVAHQIGPLVVLDGYLYCSEGDGYSPVVARDLDHPGGKVLRMTLDGAPVRDNPFAVDDDPEKARNYVWAYGFRNPFSLYTVKGHLYAADNGIDIDRFVEVKRGADYLYGGDGEACASNALFVWTPSVGPVQIGYDKIGDGTANFPEAWKNKMFIALCGSPSDPDGSADPRRKCVIGLGVDFDRSQLSDMPAPIFRYAGYRKQLLVGLAVGHDGLYVVPMFGDREGVTAILKVDYHPGAQHIKLIQKPQTALQIMQEKGCLGCHQLDHHGFGSNAPPLARDVLAATIQKRVESPEYAKMLDDADKVTIEPTKNYAKARAEVRAAKGKEKARLWIKYRVLEPKFDRIAVPMPNMGLTEAQAEAISHYLSEPTTKEVVRMRVSSALPSGARKNGVIFGAGLLAGAIPVGLLGFFFARRKKRPKAES
ncbi:MAG TPA: PQQ-dependent sugar dehydrogenase [Opitutaceae bacterium]|nr:PQQ-dependent sugar dehydrogenase [Opitutaceae bacterium]